MSGDGEEHPKRADPPANRAVQEERECEEQEKDDELCRPGDEKTSEIPVYSIRLTIESAALTVATKMTGWNTSTILVCLWVIRIFKQVKE